jgi:RecA/RadA recombinase
VPVDATQRQAFIDWVHAGKDWETKVFTGNTDNLADGPDRIPFMNPTLNRATGRGVPVGHICRWWGEDGSGKSLTNLGIIWTAQNYPMVMTSELEREIRFWERRNKFKAVRTKARLKRILAKFPEGMGVCVYDTEQRFTFDLAERMGINIRDDTALIVMDENVIENIAYQMEEAVASYHIIIIDSVSNAESFAEANLKPGEYERGTAAAAWKRLRHVRRRLDRTENTIILVDQVRAALGKQVFRNGKMEQAPPEPPQIRFLKHNASLNIAYSQGKKLYMMDDGSLTDDYKKASNDFKALGAGGDSKEVAGLEMRCKVEKNSVGAPFRHANMRFAFPVYDTRTGELIQDVGFDVSHELLLSAQHYHIVEAGGGGMYYPLDDKFKRIPKGRGKGHLGWKGEPAARAAIEGDDEMRERVLSRLAMDK